MYMFNHLPKCLYCQNLVVGNRIISPTSNEHPCICGTCRNCPYPDAYGYDYESRKDKGLPIWIDLLTTECWVDGSCDIKKDCKHFKKSKFIFV